MKTLIAFLLTTLACARAGLNEPDNILYGAIKINGETITAEATDVFVEARRQTDGPVIASYQFGSNPDVGDRYSLRLPIESAAPFLNSNSSTQGATVHISLRTPAGAIAQKTFVVGARGTTIRMDFVVGADPDNNGLPDVWEQFYFAGAADPAADPDGDGLTNLQEYQLGTNPTLRDGLKLSIAPVSGLLEVSFQASSATGPAYEGLQRVYTLRSATNVAGPWNDIPDFTQIIGANQRIAFMQAATGAPRFFRASARLATP